MGAAQTDGAGIAVTVCPREAIGQSVDPPVNPKPCLGEPAIFNVRQNFKIGRSRKRDAIFADVCLIFGGIELDVHPGFM